MIPLNKIKELAKKENKKISKKAIDKIKKYLERKAGEKIKEARKNADIFGRKIIKEEDLSLD